MNKILLLVVENRRQVLYNYLKFVTKLVLEEKIQGVVFYEGYRLPVWGMRRTLLKEALKTDCSHILFLDTDVTFEDTSFIDKLIKHDKDMVSGVYYNVNGDISVYKRGQQYHGKGLEEKGLL